MFGKHIIKEKNHLLKININNVKQNTFPQRDNGPWKPNIIYGGK